MIRSFLFGAVVGGLAVWFWHDEIRQGLARRTDQVRARAADGLEAVGHVADDMLDRAAAPLRRAEGAIDSTRARIASNLRAGQEFVRPPAPTDAKDDAGAP